MRTALFTHRACLDHRPPAGHPESPDRLTAVLSGLERLASKSLTELEAPVAPVDALLRAHSPDLVKKILGPLAEQAKSEGFSAIDPDTIMSSGSAAAALRAAGAAIAAVDAVMKGDCEAAFCAVRPPGHHAERARAMGFCLFNNVAIGALHARAAHGLSRIAIVDFDVHHGNGTQDIFYNDANLFYASSHQMPLYPGTGGEDECGVADNVLNCPLLPGSGSAEFRAIYRDSVLPALADFAPELILISAGFDAHRDDPLANLNLVEEDFAWVTHEICAIAQKTAKGRVVSSLEGGYDLAALQRSAAAHVRAMMES